MRIKAVTTALLGFSLIGLVQAQTWTDTDLGNPSLAGSATPGTDGTIAILGGGGDIWNNGDQCNYYYAPAAGFAWDAIVRVQSLQEGDPAADDGGWSKCELMVRWDDGSGSGPLAEDPFIAMMTTRADGQNQVAPQFRTARNSGAAWYAGTVTVRPSYPNQWMRISRSGSVFSLYYGTNGVDWTKYYDIDTATKDIVGDNGSTFGTPWPESLVVGVAVTAHNDGAELGSIATISNLKLDIVKDAMLIGNPTGLPIGFSIPVVNNGVSVVNPATAQLTLNGVSVPVSMTSVSADGTTTTFTYYKLDQPIAIGSTNTVSLAVKDARGISFSATKTFVEPAYSTLTPDMATTDVDTTKAGFSVRVHHNPTDIAGYEMENTISRVEQQLFGLRGPNQLTSPNFIETGVINYSFDLNASDEAVTQQGAFQADINNPGSATDYPDTTPWGIAIASDTDTSNIAAEMEAYAFFPDAGVYTMVFNSDDGFRVTSSKSIGEVLSSVILGQADVGKGASDVVFTILVNQAGYFPLRAVWFQGGGGGNLEWSSSQVVPTATGRRLLNDSKTADSMKVFYALKGNTAPAYVSFINPGRDSGNPWAANMKLQCEIVDGATAVDQGSVQLKLNGTTLQAQISKSGTKTAVSFQPSSPMKSGANELVVAFTAGTFTYNATNTFTVSNAQEVPPSLALPSSAVDKSKLGFMVKTVQADFGIENSSTGGNYMVDGLFGFPNTADLTAFTGPGGYFEEPNYINYNGNGGSGGYFDANNFTETTVPGMPGSATAESGADNMGQEILAVLDLQPGYYFFGVNSDDGCQVTFGNPKEKYILPIAIDTANRGRGMNDTYDSDLGTIHISQAGLYPVRVLWEQGGGGYGAEFYSRDILPNGTLGSGGARRLAGNAADTKALKAYQYPVANAGVPYVAAFGPAQTGKGNHTGYDAPVTATLVDAGGTIDAGSVKLTVDGALVTPTTTKASGVTKVSYKPTSAWTATNHTVSLTFGDRTVGWTFSVAAGAIPASTFWVEAEDFDFEGGKSVPAASTMPYLGGAYAAKVPTLNVDYSRNDQGDGQMYRPNIPGAKVPHQLNYGDLDRGGAQAAVNFRLGWIWNGMWFNYTRNFPAGKYNAYAALSNGGTQGTAHAEYGQLQKVTAGVGTETQTVQDLGTFDGVASGGWGLNTLVPLTDDSGKLVSLDLAGQTTLRYNLPNAATNTVGGVTKITYNGNGDYDYLLFVPAQTVVAQPHIDSIVPAPNNTVIITWSNGSTLQSSPDMLNWTPVNGAISGTPIPVTGTTFFRVMR